MAYRQVEVLHIFLQISDDLLPGHKAIGIVALILGTRQSSLPVWRVEDKGVPAMVAPGIAWLIRLFKDDMVAALLTQVVADRKPCLSPTNNDRLNRFRHIAFLSSAAI